MTTVIKAEGLSKSYVIRHQREVPYRTLRDALGSAARRLASRLAHPFGAQSARSGNEATHEEFWALKDVSFEILEGERVGIIGRNGAGKSTLLKILSRITDPTRGRVEIRGRVASLLEVGTGFHPELTGRENVYLNGAVLGMSRADIRAKFDEIVAFAEVERFLDTPVKRYSSGMYVRLAFAVAAHLEPDILVVDEVLAVGDTRFQQKCLGQMRSMSASQRTVLFVSHNLNAIRSLCKIACWLDRGRLVAAGPVEKVIEDYLAENSQMQPESRAPQATAPESQQIILHDVCLTVNEKPTQAMPCGAPMSVEICYSSMVPLQHLRMHIVIDSAYGEHILYLGTDLAKQDFSNPPSAGKITCDLGRCILVPGAYSMTVYAVSNANHGDEFVDAARFHVIDGDYFESGALPPQNYAKVLRSHQWSIQKLESLCD